MGVLGQGVLEALPVLGGAPCGLVPIHVAEKHDGERIVGSGRGAQPLGDLTGATVVVIAQIRGRPAHQGCRAASLGHVDQEMPSGETRGGAAVGVFP